MLGALGLPISSVLTGQPEVIGSSVLAAAAASVSFQFPPVYRAVLVECWIKNDTNAQQMLVRVNGATTNYSEQRIQVTGATINGSRSSPTYLVATDGVTASTSANLSVLIVKTTAASRAQGILLSGQGSPAEINMNLNGGEWNNTTDLLSRIDILAGTGNLNANTSITLWGYRR